MAGGPELDPIRVAVVDDHPLVASALESAAERESATGGSSHDAPIRLVATGRTLAEGLAVAAAGPGGAGAADVIVCDIQLAGEAEGLTVLDEARRHDRAVIILTSFERSSFMREAFERGAAGFLPKTAPIEAILDAIRVVARGGTAFPARVLDGIRAAPRPPSERELDVLVRLRDGDSNDEVARHLGLSSRTVESHLRRLFDRYGVLSRTELVVLALAEGWIAGPPG